MLKCFTIMLMLEVQKVSLCSKVAPITLHCAYMKKDDVKISSHVHKAGPLYVLGVLFKISDEIFVLFIWNSPPRCSAERLLVAQNNILLTRCARS